MMTPHFTKRSQHRRRTTAFWVTACLALMFTASPAFAFCGFYVAKADADLFNEASKVVIARSGDRTVLTMANDFKGDLTEFGMVIPMPTFLERDQINVAESALIQRIDAFTAPRLVEYFDDNPCQVWKRYKMSAQSAPMEEMEADSIRQDLAVANGVTIEAEYSVGEYDIEIIRATEPAGLLRFLRGSGYIVPNGAGEVLGSYLKQGMRFFLAKVNLEAQSKLGFHYLRPLQIAFESKKFTLPIRLGMLNAAGPQDLIVWILSDEGRAETVNYRTVKIPTGQELPLYVRDQFDSVYPQIFQEQVRRERGRTMFMEYAWDMNWCDPCAANPLSQTELKGLGVFWLDERKSRGQAQPVFVTRLHARYTKDTFPEDLRFQTTGDRTNFQGRYVLRHPWKGKERCPEARQYLDQLLEREAQQAKTLANLTGQSIHKVRERMGIASDEPIEEDKPWWKRLWEGAGF